MQIRSFAKINLGLKIGPARADGFHELRTIYQTIALHDVVQVEVQAGRGIEIRCKDPRVPTRRVEHLLSRRRAGDADASAPAARSVITIEKRLPVQGGLGAASSNAVATMIALERELDTPLPPQERTSHCR